MERPGETAEHWGCRLQRTCRRGLRGWREVRQGRRDMQGQRETERDERAKENVFLRKK